MQPTHGYHKRGRFLRWYRMPFGALLLATVISNPAQTQTCGGPEEETAAYVLALNMFLSVNALQCKQQTAFAAYQAKFGNNLKVYRDVARNQLARAQGGSDNALDVYVTELANRSAVAHSQLGPESCKIGAGLFDDLARQKTTDGLADIARTRLPAAVKAELELAMPHALKKCEAK